MHPHDKGGPDHPGNNMNGPTNDHRYMHHPCILSPATERLLQLVILYQALLHLEDDASKTERPTLSNTHTNR
jgi:hypothetical protein